MATGDEDDRTDISRNIDEWHPHRDGVLGVERPIDLILMPRSDAATWLFEECLVVIQPHTRNAHQFSSDASESSRKHKTPNLFVNRPQVH